MTDLSMPACADNTVPARRIIAAGIIRRTPGRTITVRVTAAGATGIIAKAVTR